MGIRDIRSKAALAIVPLPSGDQLLTATVTVPAGSYWVIGTSTWPTGSALTLWNILWSAAIDTNDTNHFWPYGVNLNDTQRMKLNLTDHLDWYHSSDTTNVRSHYIMIQNNDSNSHTIYFYLKAYMQPTVAGTVGSS